MAAISAGIVGAKSVISKDILYNSAIQTLILKMDADRAAVRQHIINNLQFNELAYPFEAAELDTGDYFRAGTLSNALITLQSDAASSDSASSKLIYVPASTTPGWSPPAALPATTLETTLETTPETPTPLVPVPAPGATVPPVVPPPPPPPQTLPPPMPPPPISFTPPTPARSELFHALLSDDQGNRRFHPARRALMRQCWNELINPPPDNETTWLLTATDPTIRAVASCINDKAGRASTRQSASPAMPSTAFTPTTPARSELFRALLSDDQGSRRFDPARRAMMRQCRKELINPPPENEATWLLTATDPTLQAVADCINKKAGVTR